MKRIILTTLSTLLLATGFVTAFPQQKSAKTNTDRPSRSLDLSQNKDWQKIALRQFSFYVPKRFQLEKIEGIDTTEWRYKSDDVNFIVIMGPFAPDASPTKGKNVKYKSISIEGTSAELCSYEAENADYKFVSAIHFQPPTLKVSSVTFFLRSKDSIDQEIAKKIFDSISFKDTK